MIKPHHIRYMILGVSIIALFLAFYYPSLEGFNTETLYGAKKNKSKGSKCMFDPECTSNTCLPYDSKYGSMFTCM
jgi:hypothetical protein